MLLRRGLLAVFLPMILASCGTPVPPPDRGQASPLTTSSGFQPPDLGTLTFDDPGDANKLRAAKGGKFPNKVHSIDPTGGRNGSAALKVEIRGAGLYNPVGYRFGTRNRVFVRFYFRTHGIPAGNVKGLRFHSDQAGNNGDLYGGQLGWAFDHELGSALLPAGIYWGDADAKDLKNGIRPTCTHLADGRWHWIEIDYDRDAGPNVEARLWCDGKPVILPNGPVFIFGFPNREGEYVGGDQATDKPTTIRTARRAENVIADLTFFEMISQATHEATVWIDDVAFSTQRIGP